VSLRAASLVGFALALACCAGRSGAVRWEDVEPAPTRAPVAKRPPIDLAPAERPPTSKPPAEKPPTEKPPAEKPSAEKPAAPAAARGALLVNGAAVDDGAVVELPALELACLADARALTEPARVAARVDEQKDKLGATLGTFAFVVLERDPARSLTDPPPRFCRPLTGASALIAPLLHKREPAARWLVRRAKDGVAADAAALVEDCRAKGLVPSGRPRVLLDDAGAITALALPVAAGGG
jgi:hypothetical protein